LRTKGRIIDIRIIAEKEDSVVVANVFQSTMEVDRFCFEDWRNSFKCLDSVHPENLLIPNCEYRISTRLGYDMADIDIHFNCDSLLNLTLLSK
jgi:hypothetical protein